MIALVLGADGPKVVDRPAIDPDHRETVIRLRLGGVCATDLELVKGYMGFSGVMGHEWVGEVVSSEDPEWEGRRVVGDINCPCRQCATCRAGMGNHCPARTVLGIVGRDGAFAEQFTLPLANLHLVPDGVSDEAAVFVEPLAAACRILGQVPVSSSTRVVVLGLGRLGQLCARVLSSTGAEVTGVSRSEGPLARLPSDIAGVRLEDWESVARADVVVDCTGNPEGLPLASKMVRPGGTVVLKSTTHDVGTLVPSQWVVDEITVVGSRCGPFPPALRLLEMGVVDPTDLITHQFDLKDAVEALGVASSPEGCKVLLKP